MHHIALDHRKQSIFTEYNTSNTGALTMDEFSKLYDVIREEEQARPSPAREA